ncbi:MAG: hypothetical protein K2N16_09765 [Muribaculaceae bacterium]|nr:hypothetical protein [Muribaculaceae bacterium]
MKSNGALPPEPMQEACNALSDMKLRLCSVEVARPERVAAEGGGAATHEFDLNEFKSLSPVDLIERIDEADSLQGLPDDWRDMLEEAYQQTLKEQAQQ